MVIFHMPLMQIRERDNFLELLSKVQVSSDLAGKTLLPYSLSSTLIPQRRSLCLIKASRFQAWSDKVQIEEEKPSKK